VHRAWAGLERCVKSVKARYVCTFLFFLAVFKQNSFEKVMNNFKNSLEKVFLCGV